MTRVAKVAKVVKVVEKKYTTRIAPPRRKKASNKPGYFKKRTPSYESSKNLTLWGVTKEDSTRKQQLQRRKKNKSESFVKIFKVRKRHFEERRKLQSHLWRNVD